MKRPKDGQLIQIESSFCFQCGELFDDGDLIKTRHHAIPQILNPVRNVTIPMHDKCHVELNNLYAVQQKKPKAPKELKTFTNKVEGLSIASEKFNKKLIKLKTDLNKEIDKVEDGNKEQEQSD